MACSFLFNDKSILFTLFSPQRLTYCTGPNSVMDRVSALGAGGRGFDPGPGHTKGIKNGTSGYLAWCSALVSTGKCLSC